ncbi:MAG: bacillithiol biosynthesis BshC, partial [Bacteroidetes bacterium]|nr:bacillithiol biosynthesis BshC [Bacteroidota bacterium]
MEYQAIDHAKTGFFSKTVIDYLHGDDALSEFFNYKPGISSVPGIIEQQRTARPIDRPLLVNCLRNQYQPLLKELPAQLSENIVALEDANTFTVTTAHQLNLFGGPLYYIFMIVNAIRAARDLNETYS